MVRVAKAAAALSVLLALLGPSSTAGPPAFEEHVVAPHGGLGISRGRLVESNQTPFVIRGVNYPFAWYPDRQVDFGGIKALGANTVRVVLSSGQRWRRSSPADVTRIIRECRRTRLICVLEVHDTTGYGEDPAAATMRQAVDYWIGLRATLAGQDDLVVINVANEPFGTGAGASWARSTEDSVLRLREAGIGNVLMVDAPDWGQDSTATMRESAGALFRADPLRNTMFSVHMYSDFDTPARVVAYLDAFRLAGLPLVIGEFADRDPHGGDPDEDAIMNAAQGHGVGYVGWCWSDESGAGIRLNLVVDFDRRRLTPWGERLFHGPDGIARTAREAAVFRGFVR
jgi:mannan endo-1,4-beta-mannosidase